MSANQRVFLDTTIQIERVTGTSKRQAEIAQALTGVQVLTSTYVLGEYLRTLVQDAIVLYNLVLKSEDLFDVETEIAHLFNKRSASRCLLLWAALHRSGIYDRAKLLRTLRIYLQHGLINRFMTGVDEVLDSTACGLARERPVPHGATFQLRTQCTRRVLECELVARLQAQPAMIRTLADGLQGHPEAALARMADLCSQILADPDIARGRNCTWYLGDLVIALEMPADAALYTTNQRHFAPLCELLGKQLYDPR